MRATWLLTLTLSAVLAFPPPARAQISDADLGNLVANAVVSYAQFSIFDDVNIAVSGRSVTLSGWVTMPVKRTEIAERVKKIDGVRDVVNDIEVLPVSPTDSALRTKLARSIYGHPSFWHYAQMASPPIHIVVDRGRVTLAGRVNSEVERMLAYSLAQVPGTFSVTNRLKLDRER
jgi:hyperosmotically inducible periplasmic protein